MADWRPIETAPKDGVPAMFLSTDGHIGIGIIETRDYGYGPKVSGRAAWCGLQRYEERASVWLGGHSPLDATHWLPLPQPPEQ